MLTAKQWKAREYAERELGFLFESDESYLEWERLTRDKWSTPDYKYKEICDQWNTYPYIDVCASAENTKCPLYITEEMDALSMDWLEFAIDNNVAPHYWLNPPYSQPTMTNFIIKAVETVVTGINASLDAKVLYLLPSFTDQAWFHNYIKNTDYDFTKGRIKFIPPKGILPSSPRNGSCHGVIR